MFKRLLREGSVSNAFKTAKIIPLYKGRELGTQHWFEPAILESIWKRTAEESQTNAVYVSLHYFEKLVSESIWKRTGEAILECFESAQWRKVKQLQQVWLCIILSNRF